MSCIQTIISSHARLPHILLELHRRSAWFTIGPSSCTHFATDGVRLSMDITTVCSIQNVSGQ